ncbi:MAG: hypothetical protein D6706_18720 [Chloroflexi bacterium]|nr:MAG: hypothetical protein D6706_18720 [Chloroflexota bacterium]
MNVYRVKVYDELTGEVEHIEMPADVADVYSNGTLVLKRGREVVFAARVQEWARVVREDGPAEDEMIEGKG